MAPKKKQTEDNTEESKVEVTFDTVAVGHVRLPNGDFHMIRIPVDSTNLQTGKIELGKKCEDIREAQYEFRKEAAKNKLV